MGPGDVSLGLQPLHPDQLTIDQMDVASDFVGIDREHDRVDRDHDSKGSRATCGKLPKFNHLYPILFFSAFIRFCGANKCGAPLSSEDGSIDTIVTLEDSNAEEQAAAPSPSRAEVAADAAEGTPRHGLRPPLPADVSNLEYRTAYDQVCYNRKKAEKYV